MLHWAKNMLGDALKFVSFVGICLREVKKKLSECAIEISWERERESHNMSNCVKKMFFPCSRVECLNWIGSEKAYSIFEQSSGIDEWSCELNSMLIRSCRIGETVHEEKRVAFDVFRFVCRISFDISFIVVCRESHYSLRKCWIYREICKMERLEREREWEGKQM